VSPGVRGLELGNVGFLKSRSNPLVCHHISYQRLLRQSMQAPA
jgi:hypothetical protein